MILWYFWWCRLRTAIRLRGYIVAVRSWSRLRRVARNAECDETVLGSTAEWRQAVELQCDSVLSILRCGWCMPLWNTTIFCMVVNLEKSSFWVGFSVFDLVSHFGDEKTTESIFFAMFSLLGFVMWKAIYLHCVFALVCPDVVLIVDFRVSNIRGSYNMRMRCERFVAPFFGMGTVVFIPSLSSCMCQKECSSLLLQPYSEVESRLACMTQRYTLMDSLGSEESSWTLCGLFFDMAASFFVRRCHWRDLWVFNFWKKNSAPHLVLSVTGLVILGRDFVARSLAPVQDFIDKCVDSTGRQTADSTMLTTALDTVTWMLNAHAMNVVTRLRIGYVSARHRSYSESCFRSKAVMRVGRGGISVLDALTLGSSASIRSIRVLMIDTSTSKLACYARK